MLRSLCCVALVSSAFSLAACSAPTPPSALGDVRSSIVGGTVAPDDRAVVLLAIQSSTVSTLCSAVVVSPHVLVTAAHCVSPAKNGDDARYTLYLGDDIHDADDSLYADVAETHVHPDFEVGATATRADVGVIVTKEPVAIAPLPMNRKALSTSIVGRAARLVGFGVLDAEADPQQSAGIRRQVSTTVAALESELVRVGDGAHNTCNGDSGGPALAEIDGVEQIIGVTSFGDPKCAEFGAHTRIDLYADSFVQPFIDQLDPTSSDADAGDPPSSSDDASTSEDATPRGSDPDGAATTDASGCNAAPRASGPGGAVGLAFVAAFLLGARRRRAGRARQLADGAGAA